VTVFHTVLGRGPPLILLHGGMGLDHSYFRPWMDRCSDFASVVYDGARLVVLEESGHFPFAEETDRFVALIRDWMEEGRGSGARVAL
jgi:pimeloyl-ACP methyl ester carboxylesterase